MRVERDTGGAVGVDGEEAAELLPDADGADGVFLCGVSGRCWGVAGRGADLVDGDDAAGAAWVRHDVCSEGVEASAVGVSRVGGERRRRVGPGTNGKKGSRWVAFGFRDWGWRIGNAEGRVDAASGGGDGGSERPAKTAT